jgi:hypothetical protein
MYQYLFAESIMSIPLGHGSVVTLLAVGIGGLLARTVAPYAPWLLIALGMTNLWRLFRPAVHRRQHLDAQLAQTSPLLLGVLLTCSPKSAQI